MALKDNLFLKKPGFIVSIIGIIGITFALVFQGLTILEKAIILVICSVIFVGGALLETPFFDKYKKIQEESWN